MLYELKSFYSNDHLYSKNNIILIITIYKLYNLLTYLKTTLKMLIDAEGYTTKILFEKGKDSSKDVYYIPGYFRLKVKNFTQMNLDNLSAQMNATIIFSVYYGLLPQNIVDALLSNIILLFGRDDAIKLSEQDKLQTKVTQKKKQREIQFTIRKIFQLRIESQVFWSPFEIINLILSVTVQPVVTQWGTVKVNLLDHENNFLKLSYTEEGTFGNYDLAQNRMKASYSNDRVCKIEEMKEKPSVQNQIYQQRFEMKMKSSVKKEDQKIEHFQYAHFNIPLYKFPIVAVATIFLPLWLLAIINLGIFYQDTTLSDRIASIAALMIAFVALIPTIRDQIPPNPRIVFIEILVYLQTFTSLLALIDSLNVMGKEQYNLIWNQNGLFLASCIITIISIVSVLVLMFFHYFIWQPSYNRRLSDEKDSKFDRKQWRNQNCDVYFTSVNFSRKKKFEVLADPPKQQ